MFGSGSSGRGKDSILSYSFESDVGEGCGSRGERFLIGQ